MVKFQPSKLAMRVRFPLPAPSGCRPSTHMNRLLIPAALLAIGNMAWADPAGAETGGGLPVIQTMRAEISARPSRVLIVVEDALTMHEQAACEIVKEAITSTRADARLVGEIVYTALKHAPAMSATIVECAMATAPQAAKEIEQAMERVLGKVKAGSGEKRAESGNAEPVEAAQGTEKDSGKEVSGKEGAAVAAQSPPDEELDFMDAFLPGSVGVGGIYLVIPSQASYYSCRPGGPCCSGELSPSCLKP
jgi:hypothetical protein